MFCGAIMGNQALDAGGFICPKPVVEGSYWDAFDDAIFRSSSTFTEPATQDFFFALGEDVFELFEDKESFFSSQPFVVREILYFLEFYAVSYSSVHKTCTKHGEIERAL